MYHSGEGHRQMIKLLLRVISCSEHPLRGLSDHCTGRHSKQRIQVRDRAPKCFDGMDGAIVHAAVAVALENPHCRCTLVTDDLVLAAVIKDVRRKSCIANS